MKKALIYGLAISALCLAALTGCGDSRDMRNDTTAPANPTDVLPDMDELLPEAMVPDENDGIVTDRDGIIDERNDPTVRNENETIREEERNMTDAAGATRPAGTTGATGVTGTGGTGNS